MKLLLVWISFAVLSARYVGTYNILHKILNIEEDASIDELKIAYEKLLKQWYKASRSLSVEAEILHLQIVQAYKELKSQMEIDFHERHSLSIENYKSAVKSLGFEALQSISVPLRLYNSELVKNSNQSVHLLLFYNVNSSSTRIIHNWFNLLEILTPLGVVMVSINIENEDVESVTAAIGEYPLTLPHLMLLIDGLSVLYNSDEFVDFMILDFIRQNLPEELFPVITDMSARTYLNSWHEDNKVKVLIYQPTLPVRLHYLLIAFLHRKSVSFGFVNIADESAKNMQQKMNVSNYLDTFVLFKENLTAPYVKISMTSIPAKILNDTISKNKYLTLPRVSSQDIFDDLCPLPKAHSLTGPICVILVIPNSLHQRQFDPKVTFRRFIVENANDFNNVSFMYVYNDYQPGFVLPVEEMRTTELKNTPYVVALERQDESHVKYSILMKNYQNWQNYESTKNHLQKSLDEVIARKQILLSNTFKINDFVVENPPNLIQRIKYRLNIYLAKLTLENLLPYLIFVGSVVYFCFLFTSRWNKIQCWWNEFSTSEDIQLVKTNEAHIPLQPCKRKQHVSPEVFLKNGKCITTSRELRLHELKAETYNGMVRLLKPGCRTIILMFDRVRADLLVSQFYKAVWPYRKNKNLLFGYANMEKKATLEWYSELVKACLPEQQDIEINPYFCAGTVLALSGMRKYFCLYHLKHPGIMPQKDKGETNMTTTTKTAYLDEELLIGLQDWLDRLFDGSGSVIRYRVNHWPEFKIL